jgi:hypothetical protein
VTEFVTQLATSQRLIAVSQRIVSPVSDNH